MLCVDESLILDAKSGAHALYAYYPVREHRALHLSTLLWSSRRLTLVPQANEMAVAAKTEASLVFRAVLSDIVPSDG